MAGRCGSITYLTYPVHVVIRAGHTGIMDLGDWLATAAGFLLLGPRETDEGCIAGEN